MLIKSFWKQFIPIRRLYFVFSNPPQVFGPISDRSHLTERWYGRICAGRGQTYLGTIINNIMQIMQMTDLLLISLLGNRAVDESTHLQKS